MATHTAGEWRVKPASTDPESGRPYYYHIRSYVDDDTLAVGDTFGGTEESLANGFLNGARSVRWRICLITQARPLRRCCPT